MLQIVLASCQTDHQGELSVRLFNPQHRHSVDERCMSTYVTCSRHGQGKPGPERFSLRLAANSSYNVNKHLVDHKI